jgi:hypothetical protein
MLKKLSLLGIILCLCACDEKKDKIQKIFDLKPPLKNILIDNKMGMFVSISPYKNPHYFLANYENVFLLDIQKDSFEIFNLDKNGFDTKWVPTGVYYSPIHKKLYIANYLGSNILETDVNFETKTLKITAIIKSHQTISSENISMNEDHTLLASADFDGNFVEIFKKQNEGWKQQCSVSVPFAHGITFHNNQLFATSLRNKQLLKIASDDCTIVSKIGKQSWKPEEPGFLWPTQVTPWSKDEIAVADAHTGRITTLDAKTLKPTNYFGGIGPTWAHLNMPYGLMKDINSDQFLIATAFPGRIHLGNSKTGIIEKVYSPDKNWDYAKEGSDIFKELTSSPLAQNKWTDKYQAPEDYLKLKIFNQDFGIGYSNISKKRVRFYTPQMYNNHKLYRVSNLLYFTDMIKLQKGSYLFSPQGSCGFYLTFHNTLYVIPWTLTTDCWKAGQELYNGNGPLDVSSHEKKSLELVEKLEKQRDSNGLLPFKALENTPFQASKQTDIKEFINNSFFTIPGKTFFKFLKQCQTEQCSLDQVQKISQEYANALLTVKHVEGKRKIFFEEMATACLLSAPFYAAFQEELGKIM